MNKEYAAYVSVINAMADTLSSIIGSMPGKGVSPKDANLVIYKLKNIEDQLRIMSNDFRNAANRG